MLSQKIHDYACNKADEAFARMGRVHNRDTHVHWCKLYALYVRYYSKLNAPKRAVEPSVSADKKVTKRPEPEKLGDYLRRIKSEMIATIDQRYHRVKSMDIAVTF